jgi:hypothetical protein
VNGARPEAADPGEVSRRETVRRAAVGAAALATMPALLSPRSARAQDTDEEALRDFLEEAIALEQAAALAYSGAVDRAAGGAGGRLDPRLGPELEQFNTYAVNHATAWREAIDQLGFDAPPAPESAEDTEAFEALDDSRARELAELLAAAERAQDREQLIEALIALEEDVLRFYLDSAPTLDSEDLATTSAEVAGCAAQELAVLRDARGDTPAEAADVG